MGYSDHNDDLVGVEDKLEHIREKATEYEFDGVSMSDQIDEIITNDDIEAYDRHLRENSIIEVVKLTSENRKVIDTLMGSNFELSDNINDEEEQ